MSRACNTVFWIYVILSILALLFVPASRFGLFGLEPDALSGIFAVILAQPWLSLVSGLIEGSVALVAACLAANAAIIRLICRLLHR